MEAKQPFPLTLTVSKLGHIVYTDKLFWFFFLHLKPSDQVVLGNGLSCEGNSAKKCSEV